MKFRYIYRFIILTSFVFLFLGVPSITNAEQIVINKHNQLEQAGNDDLKKIKTRLIALYTGRGVDDYENGNFSREAIERLVKKARQYMQFRQSGDLPNMPGNSAADQVTRYFEDIFCLAQVFKTPGQFLFEDNKLNLRIARDLKLGLNWIRPGVAIRGNWYNWRISTANILCRTIILMDGSLDESLTKQLKASIDYLIGVQPRLAGVNGVWEAKNHFLKGVIDNNVQVVKSAVNHMCEQIGITNYSGIMADWSYQYHERILYTGTYGAGFASSVAEVAYYVSGTQFDIGDTPKDILTKYVLEHACWPTIKTYFDVSVSGRNVHKSVSNIKLIRAMLFLSHMPGRYHDRLNAATSTMISSLVEQDIDLEIAPFLDKIANSASQPLIGVKFFPNSDYALSRQEDHYASVKMISTRTDDYETLLGMNQRGWNLANGMTYITRSGNEWWGEEDRLRDGFDWNLLPGTTSRLNAKPSSSTNSGRTNSAGGAVAGNTGMAGFELLPVAGDFRAKKSYFFFPKGFVALGSDIQSLAKEQTRQPITTTIGQWATESAQTPVVLSNGEATIPGDWTQKHQILKWIHCDNVGYVMNLQKPVNIRRQQQWLTLWMDHGTNPEREYYAYTVLPNCSEQELKDYIINPRGRILAHTSELHAVMDTKENAKGMVFWKPGSFGGITVDQPAVVHLKQEEQGAVLTVTNLMHTANYLKVMVQTSLTPTVLPEGTIVQTSRGAITMIVPTQNGRMYRIGLGNTQVQQQSYGEYSDMAGFDVSATVVDEQVMLRVALPPAAVGNEYRITVYGPTGVLIRELTDKYLIEASDEVKNNLVYRAGWFNSQIMPGLIKIKLKTGNKIIWNIVEVR